MNSVVPADSAPCVRPLTLSFVCGRWLLEPPKGYFTAVIYPEGAAFVSIRFDTGHCFHIWCIQAFLCSSEIFPISNFVPFPCPIFPNIQMIMAWCFPSLLSAFYSFPLLLLFSPDSLSLSSLDSDIQLHDMNVYSDIMFNQRRYRCTTMPVRLLQIIHKSKHKTLHLFSLPCSRTKWQKHFQSALFDRQSVVF